MFDKRFNSMGEAVVRFFYFKMQWSEYRNNYKYALVKRLFGGGGHVKSRLCNWKEVANKPFFSVGQSSLKFHGSRDGQRFSILE